MKYIQRERAAIQRSDEQAARRKVIKDEIGALEKAIPDIAEVVYSIPEEGGGRKNKNEYFSSEERAWFFEKRQAIRQMVAVNSPRHYEADVPVVMMERYEELWERFDGLYVTFYETQREQ